MSLHFKEEQRFNSWWIIAIFVAGSLGLTIPVYRSIVLGDESVPLALLLVILAVFAILGTLLFRARLETEIDSYAIRYRYFPFIPGWKRIEKEQISHAEVVRYNPIMEYGGYGYRVTFNKGKALNVKGNVGLRIVYADKKKILIGTQKPEELKRVILSLLNSKKSING